MKKIIQKILLLKFNGHNVPFVLSGIIEVVLMESMDILAVTVVRNC